MGPLEPLEWFPKRFSEGDMDSAGAKRLLGVPHVSSTDVLVRETAQNSWDARGNSMQIDFSVDLRDLGDEAMTTLRTVVFAEGAGAAGLDGLLAADSIRVIEISDRGTVGLDGATRNDKPFAPGHSMNFANFVFNLGAPRDVALGGGTYGFGKTISYVVSSVSTIVLWTRCRTEAGFEDRLIVSTMGDAFDHAGFRYTGRHWWGERVAGRVLPVVGYRARSLGQLLFGSSFADHETGTSILILDPVLDASGDSEILAGLRDAIRWNLWPKMVPEPGRNRMRITLKHHGEELPLVPPDVDPELAPFADCLDAVRSAQRGEPARSTNWPVTVLEIRAQRPAKLLGHLAVTRRPSHGVSPSCPTHHVALMRTGAELVVKYDEHRALPDEDFRWAAVFKPTVETDDAFSDAEPPAHDDWVVAGVADKSRRRLVNISLREIKQHLNEFVAPGTGSSSGSSTAVSAASLANRLAGLLAGVPGTAASPAPGTSRSTGSRNSRPRVRAVPGVPEAASRPGWRQVEITVDVENARPEGELVTMTIGVGYDGGSGTSNIGEWVRPVGWAGSDSTDPVLVPPGTAASYVVEFREDVALDFDAKVVADR
jgi:hypothetical protein